jgi:hypothetical protein
LQVTLALFRRGFKLHGRRHFAARKIRGQVGALGERGQVGAVGEI